MPLTGTYEPSTFPMARDQVAQYERTQGVEGRTLLGRPVVIITMTGKDPETLRKTPVMRVAHQGVYAAVASLAGAPNNPSWYYNLIRSPLAELQDGAVRRDYAVRELDGEERQLWWARAVAAFPDYAGYQDATTRRIPLLLLEPVA